MISLNGVRTFVVRSPDLVQRARLFVVAWERDYLVMREPLNDLATTDKSLWEKVLREAVAGAEVPSASCVTAHNDFLNAVNDYLQVVYYGRTLPDAAYRELTTETEEAG